MEPSEYQMGSFINNHIYYSDWHTLQVILHHIHLELISWCVVWGNALYENLLTVVLILYMGSINLILNIKWSHLLNNFAYLVWKRLPYIFNRISCFDFRFTLALKKLIIRLYQKKKIVLSFSSWSLWILTSKHKVHYCEPCIYYWCFTHLATVCWINIGSVPSIPNKLEM